MSPCPQLTPLGLFSWDPPRLAQSNEDTLPLSALRLVQHQCVTTCCHSREPLIQVSALPALLRSAPRPYLPANKHSHSSAPLSLTQVTPNTFPPDLPSWNLNVGSLFSQSHSLETVVFNSRNSPSLRLPVPYGSSFSQSSALALSWQWPPSLLQPPQLSPLLPALQASGKETFLTKRMLLASGSP